MPKEATLGKPNCPDCSGTGWAQAGIRKISTDDGKAWTEYPTVRICECRGGAQKPAPLVSDEMKLDAQQRAAGETE